MGKRSRNMLFKSLMEEEEMKKMHPVRCFSMNEQNMFELVLACSRIVLGLLLGLLGLLYGTSHSFMHVP
jgi:hypothetical protein